MRNIMRLFNIIFKSGIDSDDWCMGYITPIYKSGDPKDPGNYRGITLLSCLGKLFTSVINNRLTAFVKQNNIVGPEQAGFKKDHSTIDHIFTLKMLIDLYLFKKKRIYCCFIDYSKAFDTIPRIELWRKLLNCNIKGKIFQLVQNLYNKAKSSVIINGKLSDSFPCQTGVRQGDNLSPLLFSIYLHDLEHFLHDKYEGLKLTSEIQNEHKIVNEMEKYIKLFVLMYADDTILLAESEKELQNALNAMSDYCEMWKLQLNVKKMKVVVFSRGKIRKIPNFYFGTTLIDVVDHYNYLGVKFNYNGRFVKEKQCRYSNGCRAMFALLRKARALSLPIDIHL